MRPGGIVVERHGACDAALYQEWILSVGQRGIGRVAHLICEIYVRSRAVELRDGASFPFPLTQVEIGEACGLRSVPTNRMLQQLRREKIIETGMKKVHILDWDRLVEIAEFDLRYIYLDQNWASPTS